MKHIPIVAIVMLWLGVATVCAQGAQSGSSNSNEPANWRDVPVPLHAHPDTASASDRKARDDFWARFFPATPNGVYTTLPDGVVPANLPEVHQIPSSFWAIATFVNYDLHEIPVNGVYTEIHFRIDRIVTHSASATPQIGETIDADLIGGIIQESSGEIHHCMGKKAEWPSKLNPSGRYLMQFDLISPGNFYLMVDYFDLSTGVARAASSRVRRLAQNGKSHVDGLSEADAVAYIQQATSQK
jgi:hypothetical protein